MVAAVSGLFPPLTSVLLHFNPRTRGGAGRRTVRAGQSFVFIYIFIYKNKSLASAQFDI